MPINKHALIRYKVLDKCFSNPGRSYTINDLIEECSMALSEISPDSSAISVRQIRYDISFMESSEGWNIDLVRENVGKTVYYRYADQSYSINNSPLNDLEVNQLKSAINILAHFKGMPQFEWIHELEQKLKHGLQTENKTEQLIAFDNNQYLKGIENLGCLYDAILYKKVLTIKYQPYQNTESISITFHPYYLKQYNNRWFVFGYNPFNNKSDWNLALDRIGDVEEQKGKYIKNTSIDWAEYFEDIIGVTMPVKAEVQTIKLHFTGVTGRYIETKPLHGSQKSKWLDKETLEVTLDIMFNYELERLILSYADTVKVISPKTFKTLIAKRLKQGFEQYS